MVVHMPLLVVAPCKLYTAHLTRTSCVRNAILVCPGFMRGPVMLEQLFVVRSAICAGFRRPTLKGPVVPLLVLSKKHMSETLALKSKKVCVSATYLRYLLSLKGLPQHQRSVRSAFSLSMLS